MLKSYIVADHVFYVSVRDERFLNLKMDNYAPFTFDAKTCPSSSLFTLSVVPGLEMDIQSKTVLFIDNNEEIGQSRVDLYRLGDDWIFEMAPNQRAQTVARMFLSRDFSSAMLHVFQGKESFAEFALNSALMLAYAFSTSSLDTLQMHSSVISRRGTGYMFLGKSGTGKSTHSSLWLKHIEGCHLLNDDNPIVRIIDGNAYVYGSPWSGKTPCYVQERNRLGALVQLSQAKVNDIQKIGPVEAYVSLYSSCSGFMAEKSIADGLFNTMRQIIEKVPYYHLKCLPDRDAAVVCSSAVIAGNDY